MTPLNELFEQGNFAEAIIFNESELKNILPNES
jgi:hypothetical protein